MTGRPTWLSEAKSVWSRSGDGSLRDQIVRGTAGSFAIKTAQMLLTLGLMVVLARLLGAEGYGVYAYVLALVEIIGIPVQTGIGTLTVREVAAYGERGDGSSLTGLLRFGPLAILAFGLVTAGVAWGSVAILPLGESPEMLSTLALGLVLLPLAALSNFTGSALRGLKKITRGLLPENLIRPGGFLLLASGFWLLPSDVSASPSRAMLFHVVAAGAAVVLGTWMLNRDLPQAARGAESRYEFGPWLASIVPLSLITGMQLITSRADLVMLGIFGTSTEVGVYRVAAQGGILVVFGLKAINMAVAPHFSSLWSAGETARLQRVVTAAARLGLVTAVPVALVLILFGSELLSLVFGVEFASGDVALAIICVGQLVNAAAGSVVLLLNMTGHEKVVVRGLVVAAASNVALNLALIPIWGMEGAAVATVLTFGVWNVMLWKASLSRLDIDTLAFAGIGRT